LAAQFKAFYPKKTVRAGGKILSLSAPALMGIINVTPDSFYSGSRRQHAALVAETALKMAQEGAAFIDIGGYSSRPGAAEVTEQEELARVIPALEAVVKACPDMVVSVDTFRAGVAAEALRAGAAVINDISGSSLDVRMMETVASFGAAFVLMHMRGTPQTMPALTAYEDLIADLSAYYHPKIAQLRSLGVSDILLDPGFGFAKTVDHNYSLLEYLKFFSYFELPLLVGLSRKSMIYRVLGQSPEQALNGTTALHMAALLRGASILRVHDVGAAAEVIRLYSKLVQ
jgi:dihydropteroate synthase